MLEFVRFLFGGGWGGGGEEEGGGRHQLTDSGNMTHRRIRYDDLSRRKDEACMVNEVTKSHLRRWGRHDLTVTTRSRYGLWRAQLAGGCVIHRNLRCCTVPTRLGTFAFVFVLPTVGYCLLLRSVPPHLRADATKKKITRSCRSLNSFSPNFPPFRQSLDTRRLKYAFERLDHDNNGELDYEV